MQIQELTKTSSLYPKEWEQLSVAPLTVEYVGDISLLNTRKFTVVGSRKTPMAALKTGEEIGKDLSRAFTLVTGAADGGDTAAIEGALKVGGKVICVLAGGFSSIPQVNYPLMQRIMERGLMISPYPYDTPVRSFSYEYRNKLLAALGEGVLVLGAAEKSGALITAKYAKQMQKKIFALPYAPGTACGAGCNALIKNGAYLTETAEDIFTQLDITVCKKDVCNAVAFTADEEKMLATLKETGEEHVFVLSQKSGVPVFKARAVLSALEVKGFAVNVGGNRYAPV